MKVDCGAELVKRYRLTRNLDLLDDLLQLYSHWLGCLVDHIRAALPPSVIRDELLAAAQIGLWQAIERYRFDRCTSFITFATVRVRGAILDFLRDCDEHSREVRRFVRARERSRQELLAAGRHESDLQDDELAAIMHLTPNQYAEFSRRAHVAHVLSLEGLGRSNSSGDHEGYDIPDRHSSDPGEELHFGELLRVLLRGLSERETKFVELAFVHQRQHGEIAAVFGVSVNRVDQIKREIVQRWRERFNRVGSRSARLGDFRPRDLRGRFQRGEAKVEATA